MTKRQKIGIGFFWTFLFIVSTAITYAWGIYRNIYVGPRPPVANAKISGAPTPTPDPLAPRNIVLLGYGGAGHDGGNLTDTIILAHVKPKDKEVILISIPRDVWVKLPLTFNGSSHFKINHAYAIGGDDTKYPAKPDEYKGMSGAGELAKFAISEVTGLKIDNFISINFNGFKTIVEYLGGVSVSVPYSFTDSFYPLKGEEDNVCGKTDEEVEALTATMSGFLLEQQFPCRYEQLNFTRGVTYLDGETALKFVRSRHSDTNGGDFGRSLRQQAFIAALKDKMLSYKSIPQLIPVINTVSRNVQTDIDITTGIDLLREQGISDITLRSISLTTDNVFTETYSSDRQYILIPKTGMDDWDSVHEFLNAELLKTVSN